MSEPAGESGRYDRQLDLEGWGEAAQQRVRAARVLVIGVGALGGQVASQLVAAGVGQVGIVDGGEVGISDLQGGSPYLTPDIGQPKAEVAAAKLGLLNPDALVEPYPVPIEAANAEAIAMGADVVVDCSGDTEARFSLNDGCCAQDVALVVGGASGFDGFTFTVRPGASACWLCLLTELGETAGPWAANQPALGAVAAVVGSLQALAALELVAGVGEPPLGQLLSIDGRTLSQQRVQVQRQSDCTACAELAAAPSSEH